MTWEAVNARRDRIAELFRQGLTPPVIANKLGISERTVDRAKSARGLTRPRPPEPLTSALFERAKALLDDGASYFEVQRTIGVSHNTIRRHIPGYEYTRAQICEAAVLARRMNSLERDEGGRDGFRCRT